MPRTRLIMFALAALLALHLLVSWSVTAGSFFISDEITYFRMAYAMAHNGSLHVWNGFHEYPSVGLILPQTSPMFDQLYPKYPSLYAIIAAPFVLVLGFQGLFMLNALALVGVLWFTYRLGALLFDSAPIGIISAIVLLLGTYIWLQSQVIWPHMLALFFIMAASYTTACAWVRGDDDYRYTLLAGLAFSIAVAIRLDSILIAPVLGAPFVFRRPIAYKSLLTLCLTGMLGFVFLAVTNISKFGSLMPLDYGHTLTVRTEGANYTELTSPHFRPLFIYTCLFIAAFGWAKLRWAQRVGGKTYGLLWLGLVAGVAAVFWPQTQLALAGLHDMLWSLKAAPNATTSRATLEFSATGSYLYSGELKRALLQSCPFLLLGLLPFLLPAQFARDVRLKLLWLWSAAAMFIIFYGALDWDGGYGYNMRYFVPALPFMALAAGVTMHRLLQNTTKPLPCMLGVIAATILCAWGVSAQPLPTRELAYQALPLIAAVLAVVFAFDAIKNNKWHKTALTVALITSCWGGVSGAIAHYPLYNARRAFTLDHTQKMASAISDNALYIGADWQVAQLAALHKQVRVLNPTLMSDDELKALLKQHQQWGVAIYLARDYDNTLEDTFHRWGLTLKSQPNGIYHLKGILP